MSYFIRFDKYLHLPLRESFPISQWTTFCTNMQIKTKTKAMLFILNGFPLQGNSGSVIGGRTRLSEEVLDLPTLNTDCPRP